MKPMPALTLTTQLRIPADVVLQEIDGETVLLHMGTERYFGLDPVGTTMLGALRDGGSAQQAFDAALAAYDVEAPRLHADLFALLEELISNGLLEIAA